MRRLDKGKEAARSRYPAHPPVLQHRELTILGTIMLLISFPPRSRRPVKRSCRGSSTRLGDSDGSTAPEFVQRIGRPT